MEIPQVPPEVVIKQGEASAAVPTAQPAVEVAATLPQGMGAEFSAGNPASAGAEAMVNPEPRQSMHQRFEAFMTTWRDSEGTSLKDRLKQKVGKEALGLKDRDLVEDFGRLVGGVTMAAAGVEVVRRVPTRKGKVIAGAVVMSKLADYTYNPDKHRAA